MKGGEGLRDIFSEGFLGNLMGLSIKKMERGTHNVNPEL